MSTAAFVVPPCSHLSCIPLPSISGGWMIWRGSPSTGAGYLYAITSHSRNSAGDEEAAREKLVRFRIQGNRVVEPKVVTGLKRALRVVHPLLAASAEIREVKTRGGLNIEALEMAPDQSRLMLGFRSPLLDRLAIVACVENLVSMFEAGDAPRVGATLVTLDLDGNGIRGMAYVPHFGGYLVIGGPVARERTQFGLWFWSGTTGDPARRVSVPGLPDSNTPRESARRSLMASRGSSSSAMTAVGISDALPVS
jgi:hypothetical protein